MGVGRSLASTLVLRKLALRAVEHPRAGELRLRLGGGHADPEQEQGHHANRALQASHSSSLTRTIWPYDGRPFHFVYGGPAGILWRVAGAMNSYAARGTVQGGARSWT